MGGHLFSEWHVVWFAVSVHLACDDWIRTDRRYTEKTTETIYWKCAQTLQYIRYVTITNRDYMDAVIVYMYQSLANNTNFNPQESMLYY